MERDFAVWSHCNLIYKERERDHESGDTITTTHQIQMQVAQHTTNFEDGVSQGCEPRDIESFNKLEKTRKQILPWSLQRTILQACFGLLISENKLLK